MNLLAKLKGGRGSYEIDMTHGPLLGKIVRFAIPLAISGILQLLFNAADIIVVGQFVGPQALAAVGSTSALINLIINLFVGISVGANVVVARNYGARDYDGVHGAVHTSVLTALIGGVFLIFVGIALARPLLELMGTPDNVIDQSVLYMRIYFVGMPSFMLYNFGSAILRAIGDTKRPLYFLTLAGVINVFLNLFFVIVFHMGVAGVALATIISQTVSAILVLLCLMKMEGPCHLDFKHLKFHLNQLGQMLRIGLPAGLQGIVFSLSNVLIQSSVNSFGSQVMAGNTAASNIEGFVYNAMNAVYQTSLSFTSQNMGARKYQNLNRVVLNCLLCAIVTGVVLGGGAVLAGTQLLHFYSSDAAVIAAGYERLRVICGTYLLCGIMDTLASSLRGLGYSVLPMVVSLVGSCLLRLVWIATIFQLNRTPFMLYISYPISWALTALVHLACLLVVRRHLRQKQQQTV